MNVELPQVVKTMIADNHAGRLRTWADELRALAADTDAEREILAFLDRIIDNFATYERAFMELAAVADGRLRAILDNSRRPTPSDN